MIAIGNGEPVRFSDMECNIMLVLFKQVKIAQNIYKTLKYDRYIINH